MPLATRATAAVLVELIRRARVLPVLNPLVTSMVRRCVSLIGASPEFAALHLPRVGEVGVQLPNGRSMRMWTNGDDFIANQVFWYGPFGYEPETSRLFFDIARTARTTLDVGSNVGYYALLAALANPAGQVIALEPMPSIVA